LIGRRAAAIPLADAGALARARRRALGVRVAGFVLLAVLVAALALATRAAHGSSEAVRAAATTVVLLDVSGSIESPAAATIAHTLRTVARQGGHAGLVLFSDDTEEVVPPTAPARTLLQYVRLFREPPQSSLLRNPWSNSFSAGTQIGRGLAAARAALSRARIEAARVLLVSDLDDSTEDKPRMRRELLTYARDPGLELHVAAVPGYDYATLGLYRRVLGDRALAIGQPPAAASSDDAGGFPVAAVALAIAAALLLASYELVNAPLSWREAGA
jgi:hypothetical protein